MELLNYNTLTKKHLEEGCTVSAENNFLILSATKWHKLDG